MLVAIGLNPKKGDADRNRKNAQEKVASWWR
jgi:hypothetical protein